MAVFSKERVKNAVAINGDLLRWARESIGFSIGIASEKSKIGENILKEWENSTPEIKISDLKKLARTYKRTLSFFFLKNPPATSPIPKDFRTLDSVDIETLSPEVRLAIRKAQRNRKFCAYLLEITKNENAKLPQIKFSFDPAGVADKMRSYLGANIEDQKISWKSEGVALNKWIDFIEQKGVPIFQIALPKKEIRAFCLRENDLPAVIVLNSNDAIRGRIFSLFHEFYHLLLAQSDIDLLTTSRGERSAHRMIEARANEFAGSFLVPNKDFLGNAYVKKYVVTREDQFIGKLVRLYKVSAEVIYRRLVVHNLMSEGEYESKRIELKKQYEREEAKKRKRIEEAEKKFIPDYYRDVVKSSSYDLSQKAFDATARGLISTNELVTFLNVKLAGLDKVLKKTNEHYARKEAYFLKR